MALASFKCTACYTSSPSLPLFLQVAAKKLERRLAGLGGTALLPLGLGDDQHPSGYEAALDPWLLKAWAALRAAQPLPEGMPQVGREGPAEAAEQVEGSTELAMILGPAGSLRGIATGGAGQGCISAPRKGHS